jgi:3-dehydroquinate synthase
VTAVRVEAGATSYRVLIGSGLLRTLGSETAALLRGPRCAVIADETTARLFGEEVVASLAAAGFNVQLIAVPSGEQAKSLAQVAAICDQLTAAGFDRSSFIVALGGGVVGDLAGFIAAIYHRGIAYVQVPTTLLAQVDSSVGGKTGVNTAAGKNLLGAVHQPVLVIADVDTLATLPTREFNQGFAEIIKHAVIADPGLFEALEEFRRDDLALLVRRNVEIKAAVVARDEHDRSGARAVLNFGHTVGHAIERAGDYQRFLHGEAVSLGIAAACEVSVRKAGLLESDRQRVLAALQNFQLPTKLPLDFPREAILPAIGADKKFERGEVRFVVVPRLGSAHLATDVTMQDIEAAVATL